jgi:hypothetical protein
MVFVRNILSKAGSAAQIAWIFLLGGCVSVGDLADSLSNAILNQSDPQTVEAGVPAYLILLDSMIASDPEDAGLLLAGSRLYGAYASAFATGPERGRRLADRALLRRGFLDGRAGLVVCGIMAYYTFLKDAKLWALRHAKDNGPLAGDQRAADSLRKAA